MKIYVMRHGESVNNADNRLTGWSDVPLTELGVEQARVAGEKMRAVRFDAVFASDLVRARVTCETVLPGCEYTLDSRLREMCLGRYENERRDEIASIFPEDVRATVAREGYSIVGGEDREQFLARIRSFIDDLADKPYDTVAVFAHAGVVRSFFDLTFGTRCFGKLSNPNCVIAVFKLESGKLTLDAWNI